MNLGEVRYINIKEVWANEEYDFTPWLSKNLALLGKEIKMDLEFIKSEKDVGDFFGDIYAKDGDEGFVVIENQYGKSDHKHLGQLLTYGAGLEAKTLVWICEELREEHKKALDWLNENSNNDISYFGVEIKVVTIDGVTFAPLFKTIVSPNGWFKHQKYNKANKGGMTEVERKRNKLYQKILDKIKEEKPYLTNKEKTNDVSYLPIGTGRTGFRYWLQYRKQNGKLKFSCQLCFDDNEKELNKKRFERMSEEKDTIERELGKISWEILDNAKMSRIVSYCENEDEDDITEWSVETLDKFKKTFSKYIDEID